MIRFSSFVTCIVVVLLVACSSDDADDVNDAGAATSVGGGRPAMTFFVTSQPGPDGGNFGGLEGADAFCQQLAADATGATSTAWRAFLSTDDVDARTRIGSGPWHNAEGSVVAESLDALFSAGIPIDEEARVAENWDEDDKRLLLLDETGQPISSDPNAHDILTGSDVSGNRVPGQNCSNWTSSAEDVTGFVGHSDSRGPQSEEQRMMMPGGNAAFGWLSVHPTAGCSNPQFNMTGGDGRIYCFAAN